MANITEPDAQRQTFGAVGNNKFTARWERHQVGDKNARKH